MDLGLELAIGARTVGYVEREGYCQAVLLARMEDESLEPAPVFTTLEGFGGSPWRGVVDIVCAGFPCQPFSDAGQRKGDDDERAIWPEIARIIGEVEPAAVFLENVAKAAFRRPHADLLALGFECHPPCVATSQNFGAPDVRERWFVLATHPKREGWEGRVFHGATQPQRPVEIGSGATHPSRKGLEERGSKPGDHGPERAPAERSGHVAPDTPDHHGGSRERGAEAGTRTDRERRRGLACVDSEPPHPQCLTRRDEPGRSCGANGTGETATGDAGQEPADARSGGRRRVADPQAGGDFDRDNTGREEATNRTPERGEGVTHGHGHGRESEWGGWVFDQERQTLRHDADRCGVRCRICGSPWSAESPAVRMDARSATRVGELRAIGNVGAPPLVYAAAFRTLAARAR